MNTSRHGKLRADTWALLAVLALPAAAQLPPSLNAPRVGQKAPDFTLSDKDGKPVKLSDQFQAPTDRSKPGNPLASARSRWVALVFYRGYW